MTNDKRLSCILRPESCILLPAMLTAATLGMLGYGLHATGAAMFDMFGASSLEVWANLTSIIFGLVLIVAAPLVRLTIPGGLALAIGAMLGLQSIALHDSAHLYGDVIVSIQVLRGMFAAMLVLLAYLGERAAVQAE